MIIVDATAITVALVGLPPTTQDFTGDSTTTSGNDTMLPRLQDASCNPEASWRTIIYNQQTWLSKKLKGVQNEKAIITFR